MYNWQQKDWPKFQYDESLFRDYANEFLRLVGRSEAYFDALDKDFKNETLIELLIWESMKNAEIEGEFLSRIDLMSSIKAGLGISNKRKVDKKSEGMSELMLLSRTQFDLPLSTNMLFDWHRLLMKGSYGISVGTWRESDEPMQVVSGSIGKEIVHFEAPPSNNVSYEMELFIDWFNKSKNEINNPLIRAAICHLYFETIHPFEDGNGRIGRVLADKAIAQGIKQPILLSISAQINLHKNKYYEALKNAQSSLIINDWIKYFSQLLIEAQKSFIEEINFKIHKTKFFNTYKNSLNDRQEKVINKMLEVRNEFKGGMTAKKYVSITRASKATATRDLQDLVEKNILYSTGNGRAVSYQIKGIDQSNQ